MRIAILTSGILPIPAVQGGAVENLVDFYLEYNELHRLHDITVYSVWHPAVEHHPALRSEANHYKYIKVDTLWATLKKRFFKWKNHQNYYHYTIEYFLAEVLKDVQKQSFDMIILENRPAFALKLKALTNARIVYHLHNEKLTTQTPEAKVISQAADSIICVSDYIKHCVQSITTDDTKTITVHNGIDLEMFTSKDKAEEHEPIKSKGNAEKSEKFTLLFSGRVTEEKGIMQLIEALLLLRNKADVRLLVVGSSFYGNTDQETPFMKQLRTKAEPLKSSITFTGFVPYRQMPDYLHAADVAVIPSVWDDPFPTTVLEAQAAGLPIITTLRGGIPEEVTQSNAILLNTDEHFVSNLAAAILELYHHPEKRKTMSQAGLQRAKLFDKETYACNFFKALEP